MATKKVVVITGGGSGMGLEAAKCMDKSKLVVLSGRTEAKLEAAVAELKKLGIKAYGKSCDTSERESVRELVKFATSLGDVTTVINAAGVSPAQKVAPEQIVRINALGTTYVNREFAKVMPAGSAIVDIASMSAYQMPAVLLPKKSYPLAETDEELFLKKMLRLSRMAKGDYAKAGAAYAVSKNFVVWYARECAFRYGKKGIRVVSVSPGLIATAMGKAEEENAKDMLKSSCERRMGRPEELGFAIASIADERNGYLAGVDVLVDGGTINGLKRR